MSAPIVLTGFMGTGKTSVGSALADLLGRELMDTDAEIERRTGRTVPELFAAGDEPRFRALEAGLCRELATRRDLVVATGGGTLLPPANLAAFADAGWTVVLLEAAPEVLLARLGDGTGRPLLAGDGDPSPAAVRGRVESLLAERRAAYGRIGLRLDTSRLTPRQAAARVAATIVGDGDDPDQAAFDLPMPPGMMRPFGGRALPDRTRIVTGPGAISSLGPRLRALGPPSQVLLLVARPVRPIFADQLAASCEAADLPWRSLPVDDGDAAKGLDQVADLLDALAACGADRRSAVVAVGGGVTGDLAGLVAALYMRGLPLVQVPTTLLAQADASIGGKVGVNHPRAKNLIGTFCAPHLVLSDPCALRTLPPRHLANGMAEVVKTALLGAAGLFDLLERRLAGPGGGDVAAGPSGGPDAARASATPPALRDAGFLARCVAGSARAKARLVAADPCEAGGRRLLNLGHTLGHALETAAGYRGLLHGEAVAIGLLAAIRLAERRGLAEPGLHGRTRRVLTGCGLPTALPPCTETALRDALRLDKKSDAGRLRCVLPRRPGLAVVVEDVTVEELLAVAARMRGDPAPAAAAQEEGP